MLGWRFAWASCLAVWLERKHIIAPLPDLTGPFYFATCLPVCLDVTVAHVASGVSDRVALRIAVLGLAILSQAILGIRAYCSSKAVSLGQEKAARHEVATR